MAVWWCISIVSIYLGLFVIWFECIIWVKLINLSGTSYCHSYAFLYHCIFISYENIYLLRYKASFYPHCFVNAYVNNILFHKRYRFSYLHIFVSSLPSCSAYHTIHKIRQRNSRISLIVIINIFTKQLY